MTAEELLSHATEFTFLPAGATPHDRDAVRYFAVRVVWRGGDGWAVTHMADCWSLDGWHYGSMASNRVEEFPLEEAVAIARNVVDSVSINGSTWAQWQERQIGYEADAA